MHNDSTPPEAFTALLRAAGIGRTDRPVIATSNGHEWINYAGMVCCRTCGIVRRADDQNSQCKGPVKIAPRENSA